MTSLEQVLQELEGIKVIAPTVPYSSYVPLDLSIHNQELTNYNLTTSVDFENYIENYLKQNKASVAYGGYNETRNLYKRSQVFNNTEQEERNIHIGLDLWTNADTPILAALDGKVHSFQF